MNDMDKEFRHADYMIALQSERRSSLVADAVLKLHEVRFDAIAFCGMSGAIFAPMVASVLNKELIMVRKKRDIRPHNHSNHRVEGCTSAQSYLILDDQVSSGKTKQYIIQQIAEFAPNAKLVGVYEYYFDRLWLVNHYSKSISGDSPLCGLVNADRMPPSRGVVSTIKELLGSERD